MQSASDDLLTAALQLPEDERLILASRILESVPDEPAGLSIDDPELLQELNRRSADLEGAIPWETLKDEI
jgi:putative addiction module component (TIGR02574 family)